MKAKTNTTTQTLCNDTDVHHGCSDCGRYRWNDMLGAATCTKYFGGCPNQKQVTVKVTITESK
jgi:hypothetical protein